LLLVSQPGPKLHAAAKKLQPGEQCPRRQRTYKTSTLLFSICKKNCQSYKWSMEPMTAEMDDTK